MIVYKVSDTHATVGARVDIDSMCPKVVVNTDRRIHDAAVLELTPKVARALARQLNKWAKLVDGATR